MIYDDIEKSLINFLIDELGYSSELIKTEGLIPDLELRSFCRLQWSYGELSNMTVHDDSLISLLNILMYSRKDIGENTIINNSRRIRYFLMKNFGLIKNENFVAKLRNISLTRNLNNPEWWAFTISLVFNIMNVR